MHVANYTRASFGKLLDHYDRQEGDGVERSNPNIDRTRTHLNYTIGGEGRADVRRAVRAAIDSHNEVKRRTGGRALRSNATVMSDVVITLPKDTPPEQAGQFFQAAFDWMRERYGEERVPCAFVHMDETTPHMHVPLVPVMEDGTLNKAKVITRQDMSTMHPDLQERIEREGIGGHVLLTNDQVVDKALSAIPQDKLDVVRAALDSGIRAYADEQLTALEQELATRRAEMASAARSLEEREKTLAKDKIVLKRREKAVTDRERSVAEWEGQVAARETDVMAREIALEDAIINFEADADLAIGERIREAVRELVDEEHRQAWIDEQVAAYSAPAWSSSAARSSELQ